ncbi:Hypothetical protein CINCED_3A001676 [Cinara cedri]|uniref:Double jelly roll-like domain-containing protein n=1 Tax=Cinara cedri TaxID=506608 RepID=A0A5E4MG48_9HEMI|nr:Hypothetical protein CINCED_3A001676 [Cinara cedri]
MNAIKFTKPDTSKLSEKEVNITKILWRMPIVRVGDKEKIRLMKVMNSHKPITCAFRSWEFCENSYLPQNKTHSWKVKTTNKLEKPLVSQHFRRKQTRKICGVE